MAKKDFYRALKTSDPQRYKKYLAHKQHRRRKRIRRDPEGEARKRLNNKLNTQYGISLEAYEWMLAQQNGVCAICRQPEDTIHLGRVMRLCVDHDHHTGEVRALLCTHCNPAVGMVRENPLIARALADYLEAHNGPKPGRLLNE